MGPLVRDVPHNPRRAMPRALVLRLLLVLAAVPAVVRGLRTSAPRFAAVALPAPSSEAKPFYAGEFLPNLYVPIVHGPSMTELPDGSLVAAWYGGVDEVSSDISIYYAKRPAGGGAWSTPRIIEPRDTAAKALKSRVKSIGNPVLYADANGVRLYFVAIVAGGWSGGTIAWKSSFDGVTWSAAQHVVTSPLLDIGMLVRAAPIPYEDGSVALPLYHQMLSKWSGVARVGPDGRVVDMTRIFDSRPLIQPWLAVDRRDRATVVMRYSARNPLSVTMTRSVDGGASWSDVEPTPLVHRDSGVAASFLSDGSLLVFYNNTAWDRRDLSVARSIDGGMHWSRPHALVHDTTPDSHVRREYSYPYVFRTRDGRTHVLYTWQRTRIRHLMFNDAWVKSDAALGVMR